MRFYGAAQLLPDRSLPFDVRVGVNSCEYSWLLACGRPGVRQCAASRVAQRLLELSTHV